MSSRFLPKRTGSQSRRIAMAVGAILLVAALVVFGLTRHQATTPIPHSEVSKMPPMSTRPGGSNQSAEMLALIDKRGQEDSHAALAAGKSYTAPMDGQGASEIGVGAAPKASPALPVQDIPPASAAAAAPALQANPFTLPTGGPSKPVEPHAATSSPQAPNRMPDAIAVALLQSWGPRPPLVERVLGDDVQGPAENAGSAAAGGKPSGSSGAQTGDANTLAKPAGKHLLLEQGHGVYARSILAVSSDTGGPIILEATSGPFVGGRMTGSFEAKGDRLVVKLTSLAIGDNLPISIDALAVAPDTMETSVASNVDEHYMSRVILPAAAAFVQGLGQAFAQSNSSSVVGAVGGVTTTTHLNLAEQLGVGAGAAGQQVGQILQKAAPSGPTVTLDRGVSLGVVFLAPVYAND